MDSRSEIRHDSSFVVPDRFPPKRYKIEAASIVAGRSEEGRPLRAVDEPGDLVVEVARGRIVEDRPGYGVQGRWRAQAGRCECLPQRIALAVDVEVAEADQVVSPLGCLARPAGQPLRDRSSSPTRSAGAFPYTTCSVTRMNVFPPEHEADRVRSACELPRKRSRRTPVASSGTTELAREPRRELPGACRTGTPASRRCPPCPSSRR